MNRRDGLAALAALPFLARAAAAQGDWRGGRTLRIVVGFAPGGSADLIARTAAMAMGDGGAVIVENRPGASATVAAGVVARAAPDGLTVLMASSGHAVSRALFPRLAFDPVADFRGVGGLAATPAVFLVRADSPHASIGALLAAARARPGALNFGAGGNTTLMAMSAEMLLRQTGVSAVQVNFGGTAPTATALLGGQLDFAVDTLAGGLPLIRDGRMRALAISSRARSAMLPGVPTLHETVAPGFDVASWFGILAPATTPGPVVERLEAMVRDARALPATRARFAEMGLETLDLDAAGFDALLRAEAPRWAALVRELNLAND